MRAEGSPRRDETLQLILPDEMMRNSLKNAACEERTQRGNTALGKGKRTFPQRVVCVNHHTLLSGVFRR